MTDFPTFEPSSRTYEHGEFPISRHKFMTGRSQQLLHANKKSNQRLRLTYDNRPLKDFDYFLEHFNAQRGTHGSFPLTPNALFAGWNNKKGDAARMGYDQRWRYTKEPRIRSRRGMYGSMEIELQTTENVLSYPTHDSDGNPLGCDPCATPIPSTTTTAITPRSGDNGGECPPLPPVIYPPAPPVNPPGPGGTDPIPGGTDSDGADGADGGGGGPDGPIPNPSPGPGEPIPIPITPECPPGTELNPNNNSCETVPGLEDGDKIYFNLQPRNIGELFRVTGCAYREDACTGPTYYQRGCVTTSYSAVSTWPLTFRKTRETDPRPKWYIKERGCYSRGPGYLNTNTLDEYNPTPDWESAIWTWFDGDGIARKGTRDNQRGTNIGCIYGTHFAGSPDEPEFEIAEIKSTAGGKLLWQSSNFIPYTQCRNWEEDNPITQERIDGYLQSLNDDTYIEKNSSVPTDWSDNPTANLDAYFKSSVKNSVSGNSANFPTHNPSRRRITYGDYEVDRFGQAQEVTMPLPSTAQKTDLVMQLVYANQPDSVARSFMDHYDEVYGNFAEFSIPAGTAKNGTFAGWTSNKSVSKGKWLYARPPQIVTTHPGYSSTTIQLINIEPAPADKDNLLPIGLCPTDPGGGGGGGGPDLPPQYPATGPFPPGWNPDTPIPGLINIPNNFGNDGSLAFIVSSKRYYSTKEVINCNSNDPVESIFGPSYSYSTSLSDNGDAYMGIGNLSSITSSQVQIGPWTDACSWANSSTIACLGGHTGENMSSNCEIDEGIPTSGYYCRRLVLRAQWEEYGEPTCKSPGVYGSNLNGLGGGRAGTYSHFNVITQIIARVTTIENGTPVETDTTVYGPVSTPENYSESFNYWPS